jgi:cytidine deaminase
MTRREGTGGLQGRPPDPGQRDLYEEARLAAGRAYAPYSGFRVGAVAAGVSGATWRGVNVENASYPAGVCAERVALGAMVAGGEREVRAVAVATADGRDVVPCGICLQALSELGDPDVVCLVGGEVRVFAAHELLTVPFALRGRTAAHGTAGVHESATAGDAEGGQGPMATS